MKLLIDMTLSPRWVPALANLGVEAVHWSTVGRADASDQTLLAFAAANGFVVLTNDLDFGAILAASSGRTPSVIQVRGRDLSPDALAASVSSLVLLAAAELAQGALITLDAGRSRLRLLPLT